MVRVLNINKIKFEKKAILWNARQGQGSMRDAYTLLDQVASFCDKDITMKKIQEKFSGKSWDEVFPQDEYYQVMHLKLFPKRIVHAENLGGDIDKLSNKRAWIGCFPLNGIELIINVQNRCFYAAKMKTGKVVLSMFILI